MSTTIESYVADHLDAIIALSLRAWEPVFAAVEIEMGPEKYQQYYPDWRASQKDSVISVCTNEKMPTWTALDEDNPVGFVAAKLHPDEKMGEIYMVAVDPDAQGRGIASRLIELAVAWMKEQGMEMCIIDTGADPGHAPARATYAKLGFDMWPVSRFYKEI